MTAVPGWGGIVMGGSAVVVALLGRQVTSRNAWLALWLLELVLAAAAGGWAMHRKAARLRVSLRAGATQRFAWAFVPAIVAGGVLTVVLHGLGLTDRLPALWLLLYGVAVAAGGTHSIRVVPLMGVAFMLAGVVAFALGPQIAERNLVMAIGFGGIHLLTGGIILRRYGG